MLHCLNGALQCVCVGEGAASVQLLLFKPHLSLHSISYCSYGGVSRTLVFLNGVVRLGGEATKHERGGRGGLK